MTCDEFENRILTCEPDSLSAHDRAAGEMHLAGCGECRTLARQLQQLDAELTSQLKAPVLPATFQAHIQQRIRSEPIMLPVEQRAERKRQMQAEYEAGLARLAWKLPASPSLKTNLGVAAVIVLAGLIIHRLAGSATDFGWNGMNPSVLVWVASAVILAVGMGAAFPRRISRIWAEV